MHLVQDDLDNLSFDHSSVEFEARAGSFTKVARVLQVAHPGQTFTSHGLQRHSRDTTDASPKVYEYVCVFVRLGRSIDVKTSFLRKSTLFGLPVLFPHHASSYRDLFDRGSGWREASIMIMGGGWGGENCDSATSKVTDNVKSGPFVIGRFLRVVAKLVHLVTFYPKTYTWYVLQPSWL